MKPRHSPLPPHPAAHGPVPSPCLSVCRMEAASGLCEGCLRTLDEIAGWSRDSDDQKRAVWARIEARRAAA
ncbi:MAG: DUF1289 domain-containing protein [Burkholderiaceae bacterium]